MASLVWPSTDVKLQLSPFSHGCCCAEDVLIMNRCMWSVEATVREQYHGGCLYSVLIVMHHILGLRNYSRRTAGIHDNMPHGLGLAGRSHSIVP